MPENNGRGAEVEAEIGKRLKRLADFYGEAPFVSRKLSESPDVFIPYSDLSRRLLMEPEHLSMKEMEIAAVAASAALGSEHCLNVHIPQALKMGATKDELTEVIMIATLMAMTRGQSIALRKLADQK